MGVKTSVVKQLASLDFYEINQFNGSHSLNVFQMHGIALLPDSKETVLYAEKVML
jgi:hypothetical protein